jgi:hypothetical protein
VLDKARLEKLFSEERLKPYYLRLADYTEAVSLYKANIQLSESFYTTLSVLEITLRNAIHQSCKKYFRDDYWFKNKLPVEMAAQVIDTENKIRAARKIPGSDRIVSELTFGFWTSLFNRKYAAQLWKPLHQVFIHTPHHLRQRAEISPRLNTIRAFRNRIYHYEPVSWSFPILQNQHAIIVEMLNWLDADIVAFGLPK